MSDSLWPHEPPRQASPSRWCHPAISSSVVPFSSPIQSFPASGCFQMSPLFTSGGQSTGVSASASVLPVNTQDWSPLGWTGWISFQSKGLSRVFSNTTVQKHQFFWCSTPHLTHLMSYCHKDFFSFFRTSLVPSKAPSNVRKPIPAPRRAVVL